VRSCPQIWGLDCSYFFSYSMRGHLIEFWHLPKEGLDKPTTFALKNLFLLPGSLVWFLSGNWANSLRSDRREFVQFFFHFCRRLPKPSPTSLKSSTSSMSPVSLTSPLSSSSLSASQPSSSDCKVQISVQFFFSCTLESSGPFYFWLEEKNRLGFLKTGNVLSSELGKIGLIISSLR